MAPEATQVGHLEEIGVEQLCLVLGLGFFLGGVSGHRVGLGVPWVWSSGGLRLFGGGLVFSPSLWLGSVLAAMLVLGKSKVVACTLLLGLEVVGRILVATGPPALSNANWWLAESKTLAAFLRPSCSSWLLWCVSSLRFFLF